jgi:hypothetical protein
MICDIGDWEIKGNYRADCATFEVLLIFEKEIGANKNTKG